MDGNNVPVRYFGAILPMAEWERLAEKLKEAGTKFVIEPHVRFAGQAGEQATMFFLDPCGNALEFKSFQDMSRVFARDPAGRRLARARPRLREIMLTRPGLSL